MNDSERVEWSRHYDSVQWTSISVFTAAIGLLLGYVLTNAPGVDLGLCLIGWWLTNLTVYFTTGFREFRRQLHLAMTDRDLVAFITDKDRTRGFAMWRAFLITFLLADLSWLWPLWVQNHASEALAIAALSVAFIAYAKHRGRGATFQEWEARQAGGVTSKQAV